MLSKMQKVRPVFYLLIFLIVFSILWIIFLQPQSATLIHSYLRNIPLKIMQQNSTITTTIPTTIPPTTNPSTATSRDDYKQLVNFSNFEFLHLVECSKNGHYPLLLVAVHTAPSNVEKRKAIRETWGTARPEIKVVFMMAIPQKQEEVYIAAEEHEKYKDIVQGNFMDSYKNLTYKHVMVLKYVVYHCSKIGFLLKTDDDVFVNMPNLLTYLREFSSTNPNVAKPRELLLCSPMIGSPAIREESKWKVTFEEFAGKYYPPYCSGFVELFTPDTVFRLYHGAQNSRFLWVDDAFVTGIAREAANIKITPFPSTIMLNRNEVDTIARINNSFPNIPYQFMLGPVNIQPDIVRKLWHIITHRKN